MMKTYRIQKEYTNWEEIKIEANSKEEALEKAEEDWEEHYPITVDSFNYTGEYWIEEEE